MKIKIIEEQAFKLMEASFTKFINQMKELCVPPRTNPEWMDNQDVCLLLNISKRRLQYYRDCGKLPFSNIGNKCYYKPADIEALIEKSYTKSTNHGTHNN